MNTDEAQLSIIPYFDEPSGNEALNAVARIVGTHGRGNPIPRADLSAAVFAATGKHLHVRDGQDLIAKLQENDLMILSDQRGYWSARDESDVEAILKAAAVREAHALSELRDVEVMRRWAAKLARKKAA